MIIMTILYIDPQSYGNLEIYDNSLLKELPKDNIVLFACSSLLKKSLPENNIITIPLFHYNKKRGIIKVLSYLKSLFKVLLLIRKQRPSLIHVQWLRLLPIDSWLYLYVKKRFNIKIVFTAHNLLPHDSGEKYRKSYQKFYKQIDAVIVHESNSKKELIEKFGIEPNKISVIKHGVLTFNLDEEKVAKEEKEIIGENAIETQQLVFSSLGLQAYYKGTDALINVWNNCPQLHDNPNCKLIIAGRRGSMLDYSVLKSFKNVVVEDKYLSDERLIAYLRITNVILLPYRVISQSGVLLSAIGTKTPFLVTDVGGLAEPLAIADVGWKIEECDELKLKVALINLIESPQEVLDKKNNSDSAWELVQREYSWKEIGQKTHNLYCSLTTETE